MTSILNRLDVYKMGHMEQYVPGTNKVYSYLCARSDKYFNSCVWFGLQYYLKKYLCKEITKEDAADFLWARGEILGGSNNDVRKKIMDLADLGYWPLEIRALPEGSVVPVKNALMTIENTHPDFYWCVGFIESLLLKVWYPTTVATNVLRYRRLVDQMHDKTDGDNQALRNWMVHDFGYRSDSSEESAAISGAAHLLHFTGSDTVPALDFICTYYNTVNDSMIMGSVPATEHSVMCSYGLDNEMAAYERLLELYPKGIVSIVSDTYDIWRVCTDYLPKLKERILARDGKVVIRPDSGNPPDIICGDLNAYPDQPARAGVLRLLDKTFGHTVNEKGYKVLNSHIGLIYGDGMYFERYEDTLKRMESMGYAASNLVVGIGGILRQGTRDTLGFALKATHVEVNGVPHDIMKNPVTDSKKVSHCGYIQVGRNTKTKEYVTFDRVTREQMEQSYLEPVFRNGTLLKDYSWEEVRANANS